MKAADWPTAKRRIAKLALAYWTLPPDSTVKAWAADNLQFITVPTPRPGPFSTVMTPYVDEPLECWRETTVREAVFCWGSQTAKTTMLMVGLAWRLKNVPSPCLWVFPNESLAKRFAAGRWVRLLKDSDLMLGLLPKARRTFKLLVQIFARGGLTFVGSNSPANLASDPAEVVIMDEVDKLAVASTKEANAVELAEQRTKSFWLTRKVFLTSTPTVPDAPIWERYLAGDQRRYFLHCTQCAGEMLPVLRKSMTSLPLVGCEAELQWDESARGKDGTWDWARVASSAALVCPHCGHRHVDHEKTRLLREGVWRATAVPTSHAVRSYHLSSLYSPDVPWGDLAVQFLKAKGSLDGLRGFVNGALAEPWQHQEDRVSRKERVVPTAEAGGAVITRILTADVQADPPSWWLVREFYEGGHSRLVAWGNWQTFDELEAVRIQYQVAPDLTGCDSGWEGPEVYRECSRHGWFALRGDDAESWPHQTQRGAPPVRLPWTERRFDPYLGTVDAGQRRITELRWSNPTIKNILAKLRNAEKAPVRWEIPEAYATDEYFRHLDGEYLAREYLPKSGKTVTKWKPRGRRWPNHLFDCECMQLAVAIRLGILVTDTSETDGGEP